MLGRKGLMSNTTEQKKWKPVFNYEGLYEVNQYGDVRSLRRNNKLMTKMVNKWGYVTVGLRKNHEYKTKTVHRLVMQSFTNRLGKSFQVNHLDGNKENNHLSNLEWCTTSENIKHAYRIGLKKGKPGLSNPFSKLNRKQILKIRAAYIPGKISQMFLAHKYGVCQKTISSLVTNMTYKDKSLLAHEEGN